MLGIVERVKHMPRWQLSWPRGAGVHWGGPRLGVLAHAVKALTGAMRPAPPADLLPPPQWPSTSRDGRGGGVSC